MTVHIISTRRIVEQLIAKHDHPPTSLWQRIADTLSACLGVREDSPA